MCYTLYLAGPLTLSEIRSMVIPGMTADIPPPAAARGLLARADVARTVVILSVGACACRMLSPPPDERALRGAFRIRGFDRAAVIAGLNRHRQGGRIRVPGVGWPTALGAFAWEHARNAGASVYLLRFGLADPASESQLRTLPQTRHSASSVRGVDTPWLREDTLTTILP